MFACSFLLAALAALPLPDGWRLQRADGSVVLEQHAACDRRPYIHPLMGPGGKGVFTEYAPGHHHWQRGLYTGLHAVNGVNFWEEEKNRFHCEPMAKPVVDGDKASWEVKARWTLPDGTPVFTETQAWALEDFGTNYVMNVTWTLAADNDATIGKWSYGGLFLRMPFRAKNKARQEARNSRGQKNRAAEQQVAEWVEVSMPIEGLDANGVVRIEDLPGNPGYPNPWRVDGQLGIAPSPCIRGDTKFAKGEKRVNRYRLTVGTENR